VGTVFSFIFAFTSAMSTLQRVSIKNHQNMSSIFFCPQKFRMPLHVVLLFGLREMTDCEAGGFVVVWSEGDDRQ